MALSKIGKEKRIVLVANSKGILILFFWKNKRGTWEATHPGIASRVGGISIYCQLNLGGGLGVSH